MVISDSVQEPGTRQRGTRILPSIFGYLSGISDSVSYPYPGVPISVPTQKYLYPYPKIRPVLILVSDTRPGYPSGYPSCFHHYTGGDEECSPRVAITFSFSILIITLNNYINMPNYNSNQKCIVAATCYILTPS